MKLEEDYIIEEAETKKEWDEAFNGLKGALKDLIKILKEGQGDNN